MSATTPAPKDVLEWIRVIFSAVIISTALGLFIWLVIQRPDLLEGEFKTFWGFILGLFSGAALFLYPRKEAAKT
jgi:hypothetical protein